MRIQYVFRHLDQSDFVKAYAKEHVEKILTKHQKDPNINAVIKLEMENSPQHPGKDSYKCEIRVQSPRHGNLIISKTKSNMYEAISEASERLSQLFNKIKGKISARRRKRESFVEIESFAQAANDL